MVFWHVSFCISEIPQKDSDDDDSVESDVEEVHEKTNELKTITTTKINEIPLTVAQKLVPLFLPLLLINCCCSEYSVANNYFVPFEN